MESICMQLPKNLHHIARINKIFDGDSYASVNLTPKTRIYYLYELI